MDRVDTWWEAWSSTVVALTLDCRNFPSAIHFEPELSHGMPCFVPVSADRLGMVHCHR